tara:strand:- start:39 stop:593 length:555 start_codon:yes stop_codon:yes gene_type:complete
MFYNDTSLIKELFMSVYERASLIAEALHIDHVRKYTGEPYIAHPRKVAENVEAVIRHTCKESHSKIFLDEFIDIVKTVAVLHDTVEDTNANIEDIQEEFGDEVARGVWYLSDPDKFVGNRVTRKALTRDRLRNAPDYVKLIKICDINHNRGSIAEYDPKFLIQFDLETNALIEAMNLRTLNETL